MAESKSNKRPPLTPLEARARHIRHIGYVVFASAVLWIVVSLSSGVIDGLKYGGARDPFLGVRVGSVESACDIWAGDLLTNGEKRRSVAWRTRARSWARECSWVD